MEWSSLWLFLCGSYVQPWFVMKQGINFQANLGQFFDATQIMAMLKPSNTYNNKQKLSKKKSSF